MCRPAIAMRCGPKICVAASFLSVAAFDFFCVPPYYTMRVADYEYLITFAGMLAVSTLSLKKNGRFCVNAV